MRHDWPGRPMRAELLKPRGFRERLAMLIGSSLVERYDRELGAETLRSDAGWDECVKARRAASVSREGGDTPARSGR